MCTLIPINYSGYFITFYVHNAHAHTSPVKNLFVCSSDSRYSWKLKDNRTLCVALCLCVYAKLQFIVIHIERWLMFCGRLRLCVQKKHHNRHIKRDSQPLVNRKYVVVYGGQAKQFCTEGEYGIWGVLSSPFIGKPWAIKKCPIPFDNNNISLCVECECRTLPFAETADRSFQIIYGFVSRSPYSQVGWHKRKWVFERKKSFFFRYDGLTSLGGAKTVFSPYHMHTMYVDVDVKWPFSI